MWERMSIDEYAEFEMHNGTEVVKTDGVWWRCVRPFFYQPLFPFQELVPHSKQVPVGAYFGGFQHIVPSFSMANSRRNFFIWDNVAGYSLDAIGHQRRNNIKRGLKFFSVKEIDDREEFVTAGHPVYLSFYERTKYSYKKERVDKDSFARWAHCLYRFPKVKVLGAYQRGELAGISVSYLIEDALIEATNFSRTSSLTAHVYDVLAHAILERASRCPGISFICRGVVSGERRLDDSKLRKGCKIVSRPAFYQMNRLADFLLRSCMRNNYKKLIGGLEDLPFEEPPGIRPFFP